MNNVAQFAGGFVALSLFIQACFENTCLAGHIVLFTTALSSGLFTYHFIKRYWCGIEGSFEPKLSAIFLASTFGFYFFGVHYQIYSSILIAAFFTGAIQGLVFGFFVGFGSHLLRNFLIKERRVV